MNDIRARIAMAKDAFTKRRKMSRGLKKTIIKTVVWSVLLYGAETWTLRKEDVRSLNACEMWIWRRMQKVSWKRMDRACSEGEGLLKEVIEGKMEGKRPRGRPRIGMLDELKKGSYEEKGGG